MSGIGLLSVRLPKSLLVAFRAGATHGVHSATRFLVGSLATFTVAELQSLEEPTMGPGAPSLTLCLKAPGLAALNQASERSGLSGSDIVRRLVHGFFVADTLREVQRADNRKWEIELIERPAQTAQKDESALIPDNSQSEIGGV